VKHGTNGQIAAAVRGLGGDNNGINRGRRNRKPTSSARRQPRGRPGRAQSLADIEKDRLKVQGQFDEKLKEEDDARRLEIQHLTAQKGLIGDALLAEQRKEFVAEAILRKEQEIASSTLSARKTASR
jgi:hypothetical protein